MRLNLKQTRTWLGSAPAERTRSTVKSDFLFSARLSKVNPLWFFDSTSPPLLKKSSRDEISLCMIARQGSIFGSLSADGLRDIFPSSWEAKEETPGSDTDLVGSLTML